MIVAFLQAEFLPSRFPPELLGEVEAAGGEHALLYRADVANPAQNELRAKLLTHLRGWPSRGLFKNFPQDVQWQWATIPFTDIAQLFYIDYSYWNELTSHTRRVGDGAATIAKGGVIFDVPNDVFWQIVAAIDSGHSIPPPILVASALNEQMVVLEGHKRCTAYLLANNAPKELRVLVGTSPGMGEWTQIK
jgi:hypothetical protein